MTRPANGLLAGILASIPMSLYLLARKQHSEVPSALARTTPAGSIYSQVWVDEESKTGASIARGVFFGFAVWTSSLLKKKSLGLLPGYLIWGAALGFAEKKLRARYQKREIHTLH